jgi:hypothetical protein
MQDDDWIWRGIVFTYPIDQTVLLLDSKKTGRVLGMTDHDVVDDAHYIVLLDQPTPEAKAIIVHENNMRLLTCHWCRDTKQVAVTPFTEGQYNTNAIPTKECPYCSERKPERVL